MSDTTFWSALGALLTALAGLIQWWLKRRAGEGQPRLRDGLALRLRGDDPGSLRTMTDVGRLYRLLNAAMVEGGATRVMLIKATNGGGRPAVGSPVRITVLHEVYDSASSSVADHWQRRRTDEAYSIVLARVIDENYVTVHTDRLPHGKLRTVYQAQGVESSTLEFVKSTKKAVYFLSANNARDLAALREQFDAIKDFLRRAIH